MPVPLLAWLAGCALASAPEPALPPVDAGPPCIACRVQPIDPASGFSTQQWTALRKGGSVVGMPERSASTEDLSAHSIASSLVARPPSEVWAVLTDFERWPQFMPLINHTQVEKRDGAKLWVQQKFSVWFYPMRHTTVYTLEPDEGRVAWQLDPDAPHDLAASEGHWELTPVDGGQATLITYDAKIKAGRAVPDWLERKLRERSLNQMLDGLRGEVLKRYPGAS
jgi:ribosome-associated toxin RatA of RatAB toxin-antitoxin module